MSNKVSIENAHKIIALFDSHPEIFTQENNYGYGNEINTKYLIENKYFIILTREFDGFVKLFYYKKLGVNFDKANSLDIILNNLSSDARKIFLYNLDLFK